MIPLIWMWVSEMFMEMIIILCILGKKSISLIQFTQILKVQLLEVKHHFGQSSIMIRHNLKKFG